MSARAISLAVALAALSSACSARTSIVVVSDVLGPARDATEVRFIVRSERGEATRDVVLAGQQRPLALTVVPNGDERASVEVEIIALAGEVELARSTRRTRFAASRAIVLPIVVPSCALDPVEVDPSALTDWSGRAAPLSTLSLCAMDADAGVGDAGMDGGAGDAGSDAGIDGGDAHDASRDAASSPLDIDASVRGGELPASGHGSACGDAGICEEGLDCVSSNGAMATCHLRCSGVDWCAELHAGAQCADGYCSVPCDPLTGAGCGSDACAFDIHLGALMLDCFARGEGRDGAACGGAPDCDQGFTCMWGNCRALCRRDGALGCDGGYRCEGLASFEGRGEGPLGACIPPS